MARRKRTRDEGYWFHAGRGWFITTGKASKPLLDDKGNPIKSADAIEEARQAYARYLLQTELPAKESGLAVLEACQIYLDHAESRHPETYRMRSGFLFDFCTGLPIPPLGRVPHSLA